MQNISKIINNKTTKLCFYIIALALLNITSAFGLEDHIESRRTKPLGNNSLMSSVIDLHENEIKLNYSKKNRRIWLSSKRFKHKEYTITRLEKEANPELIGAEKDIQILFGRTIELDEREFLVLTTAERTSRGDGGGQCGSGEEIYLKVYELYKNDIIERNGFLIHSCAEFIDLDPGDGSSKSKEWPITLERNTIQIKWLGYPHHKGRVIGSFDILKNRLNLPTK